MRYLVIDGNLSGTGIRDAVEGGWLAHTAIEISEGLSTEISAWQQRYELAHFRKFSDLSEVDTLDNDGILLRKKLAAEISDAKIQYFSSAKMQLVVP